MLLLFHLAVATIVCAAPERAATNALSFQPRARAVLLVVTPKGTTTGLASATLFDAANAELERRTDLELESIERTGVDLEVLRTCPDDRPLGCWVSAIVQSSRSGVRAEARLLFVVSLYPIEHGEHVLHFSLVDLPAAHRTYLQIRDQGEADWQERAEDALHAGAVHADTARFSSLEIGDLRAYFASRFDGDFRSYLERSGHSVRLGRVVVGGTPAGLELAIDGRVAGLSRSPETEVTEVPAGTHELVLRSSDGSTMRTTVNIEPGVTARVEYVAPPPPASLFRRGTFWTAVGLGAVGAAISVAALVQAGASVQTACVISPGADSSACPVPGFPTLGFDPGDAPSTNFSELNPGGPSTAALGLSLLGAGGVTAASLLLFGEPDEVPWPQIAAGVAVGVGALLVVSLVDPRETRP